MTVLGLDTSNYTTSAAVFDGQTGRHASHLLPVPEGQLGLRQRDAVFEHVRRLPQALRELDMPLPSCIGVSTRPTTQSGSYMPCFETGRCLAECLGAVLRIPVIPVSHQQGHIAAAAYSAGRLDLLDKDCYVWHVSGGTTDLLRSCPGKDGLPFLERIGGTLDLCAGQLVDRVGKQLGLPFPAGQALERLAMGCERGDYCKVYREREWFFSLSGVQNKAAAMGEAPHEEIARYTLLSIAMALRSPGDLPRLCCGGVLSNRLIRSKMREAVFAEPELSRDNALGVAVLAWKIYRQMKF